MSQAQLDDLFTQKSGRRHSSGRSQRHGDRRARHDLFSRISPVSSTTSPGRAKCSIRRKACFAISILPFGLNAIIAKVYKGPSWIDNKECIVLDYSETSLLAHWIRDEIRDVAPAHLSWKSLLEQKAPDRFRAGISDLTEIHRLAMPLDSQQLLRLSKDELDDLFARSSAGNLPDGEGTGTALLCPGSILGRILAWLTRWFVWQGDVFHADKGLLYNRISPFGFRALSAKVFKDRSQIDQKECIAMDYSASLPMPRGIRDEMREVAPGLYLGTIAVGAKRTARFALSFQYQPERNFWRRIWATAGLATLIAAVYLGVRFQRDDPVVYADPVEHFKYGSTGGERESGLPYWIWKVLPKMFPEYLPGKKYVAGQRIRLVRLSLRTGQGSADRRFTPQHSGYRSRLSQLRHLSCRVGPGNAGKARAFFTPACRRTRSISKRSSASSFAARPISASTPIALHARDGSDRRANTIFSIAPIMRYYAIPLMRERLLMLKGAFSVHRVGAGSGPGADRHFQSGENAARISARETGDARAGRALRFSVHLAARAAQGARPACALGRQQQHDGGTQQERRFRHRHVSADDRSQVRSARVEQWLLTNEPPKYPFAINAQLSARR